MAPFILLWNSITGKELERYSFFCYRSVATAGVIPLPLFEISKFLFLYLVFHILESLQFSKNLVQYHWILSNIIKSFPILSSILSCKNAINLLILKCLSQIRFFQVIFILVFIFRLKKFWNRIKVTADRNEIQIGISRLEFP